MEHGAQDNRRVLCGFGCWPIITRDDGSLSRTKMNPGRTHAVFDAAVVMDHRSSPAEHHYAFTEVGGSGGGRQTRRSRLTANGRLLIDFPKA